MKKSEIIQSVCLVNVPQGSELVEHSVLGFKVAQIDSGDIGGLRVLQAQNLIQAFEGSLADLPDEPNSTLFSRLHEFSLRFHKAMIDESFMEEVEEGVGDDHRAVVARLREIAKRLGITYTEPEDDLLAK